MDQDNILNILKAHEEAIRQLGQDVALIKVILKRDQKEREEISEEEE
jgi:hypothetical protein